MMLSKWLLLLDTSSVIEEFFAGCNIPFDCEFIVAHRNQDELIVLNEIYRVAKGLPLQIYNYGHWKSENDFNFTSLEFYRRRSNLNGLFIPAATIENPPITELEESEKGIKIKGFFGRIWNILEDQMNFTSSFTVPEDGERGLVMKNGTANGMIRMIEDEQVHVAVDAFGFSAMRAKVVDFTVPLLSTKYCVLVKPPDTTNLQWNNFLAPFSEMLWVAMVVTVLVIAIHLTLLCYLGQHYGNHEAEHLKYYTFSDSLLLVLGIFCQQGNVHLLSIRVHIYIHKCCDDIWDVLCYFHFLCDSAGQQAALQRLEEPHLRGRIHIWNIPEVHASILEGMNRVCNSKHSLLVTLDTALAFKNKIGCNVVPPATGDQPLHTTGIGHNQEQSIQGIVQL
ncbi:hypothetical protein L9F63_016154 [Diploptera punctata]|uniref:Uncharacterized protein n=1 Tax=Diploptera punctata TaxID=6984 RepID=A0AAD8A1T8_DIPPU|nr:hypothetical protein L9F63_016154 [Diploptera punctata]